MPLTKFSREEIERFYEGFTNLTNTDTISLQGFKKLMKVMGIRISSPMEDRIFNVIDVQKRKNIDFNELMEYFNTILKGTKDDRLRFSFRLLDYKNKGWFDLSSLKQLLVDLHKSDLDDKENSKVEEELEGVARNMFDAMNCNHNEKIDVLQFQSIIEENEEIFEMFQALGSNISDLMDTQGQNKYSKVVDVIKELNTEFTRMKARCHIEKEYRKR